MDAKVFSSGFLLFRRNPEQQLEFLLMKHVDRWDLPKGHLDSGESKFQAAVRELNEETGLHPNHVWTDPNFEFVHQYWVTPRKDPSKRVLKELTIYLGFIEIEFRIIPSEHPDYQWMPWNPPHRIQQQTIDPLLFAVENYLNQHLAWPECIMEA